VLGLGHSCGDYDQFEWGEGDKASAAYAGEKD